MAPSKFVKLSKAKIAIALSKLPEWKLKGGKLHREYKFADFIAAFGFMTGAALVAQGVTPSPKDKEPIAAAPVSDRN